MRSTLFVAWVLGVFAVGTTAGCAKPLDGGGGSGDGGSSGTGGAGSGGTSASGGTNGSGGVSASGGVSGVGGSKVTASAGLRWMLTMLPL